MPRSSSAPLPDPAPAADAETPAAPGAGGAGSADGTGSRFHLYSFLLGLLTGLLLVGGTLLVVRQPTPPAIVLQPPPTPAPAPSPTPSPTPGPITVFVSGAVMAPGVIELPADSRAGDAITAAGGLDPSADAALVNQAQPLWDGAQVHVPAAPAADGARPLCRVKTNSVRGEGKETLSEAVIRPSAGLILAFIRWSEISGCAQ